ncbi:MAG: flagellar biosynthesis protein FliQ [Bacteroidetes bacterium]|nr:flagellar biosynthesis protein FliQ [Bacteroidota bacterium]
MNSEVALYWIQSALKTAITIGSPLLLTALAVGLTVSLIQAVTSIQEMTLSYIPKMIAVGVVLLLLAPWLLEVLVDFMTSSFHFIPDVAH